MGKITTNTLFYGDNLDILREYIDDESIDLIYLDPPFNSKATYNILFEEKNGSDSAAQIKAFEDTWHWDSFTERVFKQTVEAGGKVSQALTAFRILLGNNDLLAYLTMMAPRIKELFRVLKPSGNIFLHCDPTASHYIKILLDSTFGGRNFVNEIVWCYSHGGRSKKCFGKKHDIIFWYSKSDKYIFNLDDVKIPMKSGVESFGGRLETDKDGRVYRLVYGTKNKKGETKYYKYYLDEGKIPEDYWTDINSIQSGSQERLGYPTQKPEALLERIIKAGSNENGTVLDPFCGCGTAISVAQKINRNWIGIDITHAAINLIKRRLYDSYKDNVNYEVIGEPVSLPDAKQLAEQDPYQFQWWSLGLVGARPTEGKKGADTGIDGRLFFFDDESGNTKQIIFSVKAGHIIPNHIRDLRGVLDREKAEIGVFITLKEPTPKMKSEAASCGFYESLWGLHPKLQILTIQDLLEGKRIDMPPGVNRTYKKAIRIKKDDDIQHKLDL